MTQDWTELGVTWNCPNDTNLGNTNPNCPTQWAGGSYVTPQTNTIFQGNTTGWVEWDVTTDVQAFLSGTSNYGWLIRKRSSTASGSLDFTSREGNASNTPRLILTINNAPPVVVCSPSPAANSAGWNKTNVTVTCTCSDPDGISFCTSPQVKTNEGAGQVVTCQATDSFGATSSCNVTLNIDKTAPNVSIISPTNGSVLNTCQPTVSGNLSIGGSAISNIQCNDMDGTFATGTFSCQPSLATGAETINVQVTDLADNIGSASISVTNTTTNGRVTLNSKSPIIASVGDPDTVALSGDGFEDTMDVFQDGVEVPYEFVNTNSILLSTNFNSQGTHIVEIKKQSSCPQSSTTLEPGVLSIQDGQILVYPETAGPNGGESVSIYANQGSFEPGAIVYLANANSNCATGRIQTQSVTYIDDKRLDVLTPSSSLGNYDLLIDNPTQSDLCKASAIGFVAPQIPQATYDARYSCCQSVPPPTTLQKGQTVTVKLRVKNTGTSAWRKTDGIRLGSYNGSWGVTRVELANSVTVNPNQFYMFVFQITAPSQAGTYLFKWQMRNENGAPGQKWFGQIFPCSPDASCQSGDCTDAVCNGIMSIQVTEGGGGNCPAAADSNCQAACPTDTIPDTNAIQACLNNQNIVELSPGSPGYIIDNGSGNNGENAALVIPANKTLKTVGDGGNCWSMSGNNPSVDYNNCALLKASTTSGNVLSRPMLKLTGGGVSVYRVILDGLGDTRRGLSALDNACDGGSTPRPGNIRVVVPNNKSWSIEKSVSMGAMCGTALLATGKNYIISDNLLWNNGASTPTTKQKLPWADGVTALLCDGGTIKNNKIVDATDVGIAGGGIGSPSNGACNIHHNFIRQNDKHAFSGVGVAVFSAGKGEWGNSTIWKNTVDGNNKMDLGIHMGKHPWLEEVFARGGTVGHTNSDNANIIKRTSINLSVDGWLDGIVKNNQLSLPANVAMQLSKYDCCGSIAYGKNFTISDYADNNGPNTLTNQQGTPDEYLTLHSITTSSCVPAACGNANACSVCEQPASQNCACRNQDGTCKQCPFPQIIPADEKEN